MKQEVKAFRREVVRRPCAKYVDSNWVESSCLAYACGAGPWTSNLGQGQEEKTGSSEPRLPIIREQQQSPRCPRRRPLHCSCIPL